VVFHNGRQIAYGGLGACHFVSDFRISKRSGLDKTSSGMALTVLAVLAGLAALRWAEAILIPLALAFLLSFALTPVVMWLQRIHFGRAPAVLLTVTVSLGFLVTAGWFVAGQLVDIATQLPQYRENVHRKLLALQGSTRGRFGRLAQNLTDMSDEFGSQLPGAAPTKAVPVQVVNKTPGLTSARDLFGPLVTPLEDLGIVVIFAIFLLFEREKLRDRLLRLVGLGQLGLATKTLDDAAAGVSRYLQMQMVVNASAGFLFAFGLALIGVPHAYLWGSLLGLLRFVPYVGSPVAALMPVLMTVVSSDGWMGPLLTIALFLVLEVALAQFIEPWLYGAHTGISSLAILVAGVFWGFLWGPVGLILSTPLTVCLVVLGRHVPCLEPLQILLGNEAPLEAEVRYYQRLLALDASEAREIVIGALKEQSLEEVYDQILLPALSIAEQDKYRSEGRDARMDYICQSTMQIVEELGHANDTPLSQGTSHRLFCLGASDSADAITASMLVQVFERQGWPAVALPDESSMAEASAEDTICVCALPPLAVMHARSLAKQLRTRFPDTRIVVCLWGLPEEHADRAARMLPETMVSSMKTAIEAVKEHMGEVHHTFGPAETTLSHA
jgi:predicted PurR-regulated permease PerM